MLLIVHRGINRVQYCCLWNFNRYGLTDESISIGKGFGHRPEDRSQILESIAKATKRNGLSAHPSKAKTSAIPRTPEIATDQASNRPGQQAVDWRRTQRLSQTKSAIARGITSAFEYQIAT